MMAAGRLGTWDAVCGKKACNVFLATVGFLLKLMFALGLLSNTAWTKWKEEVYVAQGDLSSSSLHAESKSFLSPF